MATTQTRRNLSISLPADLADELDAWAAADGSNRSAVVVGMVKAERRRRIGAELERVYRELTEDVFYDDIECYLPAQVEVALANPWEPEAR